VYVALQRPELGGDRVGGMHILTDDRARRIVNDGRITPIA
jgi:hypothetical protein